MESKKSLRRQLEEAHRVAKELRHRLSEVDSQLNATECVLDNLGYEPVDVQHPVFDRTERDWRLTEAQSAKNTARDAERAQLVAKMTADARDIGHREALGLVLEALEIPGYKPTAFADYIGRFRADLNTAVEVRRDIAAAAERGRTEKKVADLLKRPAATDAATAARRASEAATASASTSATTSARRPDSVLIDSAAVAKLAEVISTINPVTKGAAASAKSTTIDHDVATAGESLEAAA